MEKSTQPAEDKVRAPSRWPVLDYLIGFSFVAAGATGIASAYNNIRHNFLQAFVYGYDNKAENWFTPRIADIRAKRDAFHGDFDKGTIKSQEFGDKQRAWVKQNTKLVNDLIDEKFEIAGKNPLTRFINRTATMAKLAGKTSRNSAVLGIAGTTAIGIGAVGIVRHSKSSTDRMNDLIDRINEREHDDHGRSQ